MGGCSYLMRHLKKKGLAEGWSSLHILRMKADTKPNIPIQSTATFKNDLQTLTTHSVVFTINLEIFLGETLPTKWIEVLPRLKLKCDALMVAGLIIQNKKVRAANPIFRTQVGEKGPVGLQYFQIAPWVDFIRLLSVTTAAPDTWYLFRCSDLRIRVAHCTHIKESVLLYLTLEDLPPDQQF